MVFVFFVVVAFASLQEATVLWAKAMFTLAIAVFGVALLGLLFRRRIERATWSGYFFFGAGYLTLYFGPGCVGTGQPPITVRRESARTRTDSSSTRT
jgi:hypothetical protein